MEEIEIAVNCVMGDNNSNKIKTIFALSKQPFRNYNTEYKFLKYMTDKGLYQSVKKIQIKKQICETMHKGIANLDVKTTEGTLMPIEFQIQKFFSLPHVLEETLQYTNNLIADTSGIRNFVQAKIWKKNCCNFPTKS